MMLVKQIIPLLVLVLSATCAVQAQPDSTPTDAASTAKITPLVGWLELSGDLSEGQVPFAWLSEMEDGETLQGVLDMLRTVERSDRYSGLVIYLDEPQLRLTQTQALGEAIRRVRAAGRTVMVFAESYGLNDYLLASYADRILLQHRGAVILDGLALEELYLTGLLEMIGVRADLEQIGRFKGANEALTRREPSEAWNQNINGLLDDLYGQIVGTLAENRGVGRDQVERWLTETWTMTDTQLVAAGLIDELVDRDLLSVTEVAYGDDFVWDDQMGRVAPTMKLDSPFAIVSLMLKKPSTATKRPTLAVIHANGPITSGESRVGAGLFAQESIGSRTMVRALGQVRDDDNIRGAVIQLDSPGGSALASEVIWQAMRKTAEKKPVYVSIGPMAASGGYYMAVAAEQIYVHPQSIVGSIGVVGGKLVLGGLYSKVGVTVTRRDRGPLAGMFNSVEPFTIHQRRVVRDLMQKTYDQFVERVKIGRGTRLADLDAVAEGRLFTGRAAQERGMVDRIGTLDMAVTDLADALDLAEGSYDVLHLPPAMSLEEFFAELFRTQSPQVGAAPSPELDLARRLLGPAAWQAVQRHLAGLMLLHEEPVLALMPQVLIVK